MTIDRFAKKEQWISTLEYITERLERPLYSTLDAGFRHHPLNDFEKVEIYKEVCDEVRETLKWLKEHMDYLNE